MVINPLAMIILIAQYLIIFGFLFSAFMFARGKSSEGWKWLENSIVLALAIVVVPGIITLIFTGNANATSVIINMQVPNYYIGLDTGYPHVVYGSTATQNGVFVTTVTYSYTYSVNQQISAILINFGVTGSENQTIIIQGGPQMVIPASASPKYVVAIFTGANEINNDAVNSNLNKTVTLTDFLKTVNVLKVKYSPNNKEVAGAFTEILAYVDGNNNTHTFYKMIATVAASASPVKVSSGGSGLGGAIAWAMGKVVNLIMDIFSFLGSKVADAMPSISGEKAMLMFVLMPTDNMISAPGQHLVHDYYYNKAMPIGMAILIMTTILAFIENMWNGSGDTVFSIAKKFTGIVIWMLAGYYFYVVFANFIDGIILYIGLNGILWFGSLINSLYGMIILLGIATSLVSNNITGTALGMVLGALYLFMAFAIFKFFIIIAVVAMFPIIAPFGMINYGPSMNTVISKMVEMGIFGIIITTTLQFLYYANQYGGSIVGSISGLIAIYLLFSPGQVHSFLGGLAKGESLSFEGAASIAQAGFNTAHSVTKTAAVAGAAGAAGVQKIRHSEKTQKLTTKVRTLDLSRTNRLTRLAGGASPKNDASENKGVKSFNRPTTPGTGGGLNTITPSGAPVEEKGVTPIKPEVEKTVIPEGEEVVVPEEEAVEPKVVGGIVSINAETSKPETRSSGAGVSTNVSGKQATKLKTKAPKTVNEKASELHDNTGVPMNPQKRVAHNEHPLSEFTRAVQSLQSTIDDYKHAIREHAALAEAYRRLAEMHEGKSKASSTGRFLSKLDTVLSGMSSGMSSGFSATNVKFSGMHKMYHSEMAGIYRNLAERHDEKALEAIGKHDALRRALEINEDDLRNLLVEHYQNIPEAKPNAERFAKEDIEEIKRALKSLGNELTKEYKRGKRLASVGISGEKNIKHTVTTRQRIVKMIQERNTMPMYVGDKSPYEETNMSRTMKDLNEEKLEELSKKIEEAERNLSKVHKGEDEINE